ncbi:hypothetical protein CIPAW_11G158900 [Carya illinoinensis]|uniref:Uncharacterized protein n=1 Tax=Carya illinoinensis TaxID=32201 RepID=A0A8T1P5Q6_CARIL|nr:hypothetical protein CIPAW_11G158900 [Carya illinoinensis]
MMSNAMYFDTAKKDQQLLPNCLIMFLLFDVMHPYLHNWFNQQVRPHNILNRYFLYSLLVNPFHADMLPEWQEPTLENGMQLTGDKSQHKPDRWSNHRKSINYIDQ